MKTLEKVYYIIGFIVFYICKLIQANFYIAYDIITPKLHINPGYLYIPIRTNTHFGLLLFSNLLSMTPGTLSVDITHEKTRLLVHYLYGERQQDVLDDIEKIQQRITRITNK